MYFNSLIKNVSAIIRALAPSGFRDWAKILPGICMQWLPKKMRSDGIAKIDLDKRNV